MATVFGIEDVKPLLGSRPEHDNVLAGIIAEAEAIVTARCGPLVSTSITKRLSPNAEGVLALPVYPIVSVGVDHQRREWCGPRPQHRRLRLDGGAA